MLLFLERRYVSIRLGYSFDKETTDGHFALDKSILHIDVLELKAVLFGLKNL